MRAVLTIAGSDPSGGAGLEQDLRVFQCLGRHGMAVATAHTIQDFDRVHASRPEDPNFFRQRLRVLADRYEFGAIKIGMLATASIVEALLEVLETQCEVPIVLDPVFRSSSGASLLSEPGLGKLASELLSRVTVSTPNRGEAEVLASAMKMTESTARAQPSENLDSGSLAKALASRVRSAVLLTGGDDLSSGSARVSDELAIADATSGECSLERFASPRIAGESPHGTGCALSAAIAVALANGAEIRSAIRLARDFVHRAIIASNHFSPRRDRRRALVFQSRSGVIHDRLK